MDLEIPIKASFDGEALEVALGSRHIKSRASGFWNVTKHEEQGDWLCHVVMEQDRREKALVPAGEWDLVAEEKERVAVQDAAGKRAEAVVKGKAKVAVKGKDPPVDKTSRCLQMSF